MKLLTKQEFSTKNIVEASESGPAKSRVYLAGKATDSFVTGEYLEACIEIERFYLLFMADNVPFQECLQIYLLDKNLVLLDSALICAPYSIVYTEELELCEPDCVKFDFIGELRWQVQVLPEKKLHIPILSDPLGVLPRFRFRSYLEITNTPQPERA